MQAVTSAELPFLIESTKTLNLGGCKENFSSGCRIIQIKFDTTVGVQVDSISFKNKYTAFISIRCKIARTDGVTWLTAWRRYQLMPDPHCETGSQSEVVLRLPENRQWHCLALRLILQQPSPHWTHFDVTNLQCFQQVQAGKEKSQWDPVNDLSLSTLEETLAKQLREKEGYGFDTADGKLAEMDRLAKTMKTLSLKSKDDSDPDAGFEVNGSYDVNLLSYT